MADDDGSSQARPPMNAYTAMLALAFVAIAIGCIFLTLELFARQLPLAPGS